MARRFPFARSSRGPTPGSVYEDLDGVRWCVRSAGGLRDCLEAARVLNARRTRALRFDHEDEAEPTVLLEREGLAPTAAEQG